MPYCSSFRADVGDGGALISPMSELQAFVTLSHLSETFSVNIMGRDDSREGFDAAVLEFTGFGECWQADL